MAEIRPKNAHHLGRMSIMHDVKQFYENCDTTLLMGFLVFTSLFDACGFKQIA